MVIKNQHFGCYNLCPSGMRNRGVSGYLKRGRQVAFYSAKIGGVIDPLHPLVLSFCFFVNFESIILRNLDRKNASEFLDNIWTFGQSIVTKEYDRVFQIIIRRLNRSSYITGNEKRSISIK